MKKQDTENNGLISAHWNNSRRCNQSIQCQTLEKTIREIFISQQVGPSNQQIPTMKQATVLLGFLVVIALVRETRAFTAGIGNMGINGKRDITVKVTKVTCNRKFFSVPLKPSQGKC